MQVVQVRRARSSALASNNVLVSTAQVFQFAKTFSYYRSASSHKKRTHSRALNLSRCDNEISHVHSLKEISSGPLAKESAQGSRTSSSQKKDVADLSSDTPLCDREQNHVSKPAAQCEGTHAVSNPKAQKDGEHSAGAPGAKVLSIPPSQTAVSTGLPTREEQEEQKLLQAKAKRMAMIRAAGGKNAKSQGAGDAAPLQGNALGSNSDGKEMNMRIIDGMNVIARDSNAADDMIAEMMREKFERNLGFTYRFSPQTQTLQVLRSEPGTLAYILKIRPFWELWRVNEISARSDLEDEILWLVAMSVDLYVSASMRAVLRRAAIEKTSRAVLRTPSVRTKIVDQ